MSADPPRRAPKAFDVPDRPAAEDPAEREVAPVPRRPTAVSTEAIAFEDDALVALEEVDPIAPPAPARRAGWWTLALSCLTGLIGLAVALWIERLIGRLFETAAWAGAVGLALLFGLVIALAALAIREILALRRLGRRAELSERAGAALATRDDRAAEKVVRDLATLLAERPETAEGRAAVEAAHGMVMDARERLLHAEQVLLGPIDDRARLAVAASSRRVSVVTAVAPRALIDIAYVLLENARLVRSVATLYGLRPGRLGFLRLLRDVLSHLAVTGVVSLGDGIIEQALGHGVASRVSARFGEGVLNGLLTARVGAAAIDLCRPLPFRARPRPTARDILRDVANLRGPEPR